MKKILLLLLVVTCFISCNWECPFGEERCAYCHNDPCICYNRSNKGDYFSASTLIGEWQMAGGMDDAYMKGCGIIPKDIVFLEGKMGEFGMCTITYSIGRDPQWYVADLYYNYVRRELTFYIDNGYGGLQKFVAFTFKDFLFPTLVVQDSFGTYEWRKVRVF